MPSKNRSVYRRKKDNKWVDKSDSANRPATVADTQKEAIDSARRHSKNSGGGEVTIMGEDGKIKDKITVPPGNDPFPPKDKK
jgi:hypothetical protein